MTVGTVYFQNLAAWIAKDALHLSDIMHSAAVSYSTRASLLGS